MPAASDSCRQLALCDAAALRNLAGIKQQFVFHGIGGIGAGVGQGVAVDAVQARQQAG